MSFPLLTRVQGDACFLTLNRPEVGNCLSAELVEELHRALDTFEASPLKVVIFQGEGRHFCTGFDLADLAGQSDADLALRFIRIEQLLARIWNAPYPTMAVAAGRTFGAGADLFAACGWRIALEKTSFCFPGAGFGVVLGTARLAARIGSRALEWIETGREIAVDEAERLGLVQQVTCPQALPGVLEGAIGTSTRLDATTLSGLRAALAAERGSADRDLAELVRSVARPGLKARMEHYRSQQQRSRVP